MRIRPNLFQYRGVKHANQKPQQPKPQPPKSPPPEESSLFVSLHIGAGAIAATGGMRLLFPHLPVGDFLSLALLPAVTGGWVGYLIGVTREEGSWSLPPRNP